MIDETALTPTPTVVSSEMADPHPALQRSRFLLFDVTWGTHPISAEGTDKDKRRPNMMGSRQNTTFTQSVPRESAANMTTQGHPDQLHTWTLVAAFSKLEPTLSRCLLVPISLKQARIQRIIYNICQTHTWLWAFQHCILFGLRFSMKPGSCCKQSHLEL